MRKLSDLTAGSPSLGSSVASPLSYKGMDEKEAAICSRSLLHEATGLRDVLAD